MGSIELRYVTRDEANGAIRRWHRHHKPVRSHYLASGAFIGGQLVGVVIGGTERTGHYANCPRSAWLAGCKS